MGLSLCCTLNQRLLEWHGIAGGAGRGGGGGVGGGVDVRIVRHGLVGVCEVEGIGSD